MKTFASAFTPGHYKLVEFDFVTKKTKLFDSFCGVHCRVDLQCSGD